MECCNCGCLYVSPRPTDEAIARFYSAEGHYDHWEDEAGRPAMWRRRLNRVRKYVRGGRLLDIGAGQGDFGAVARESFEIEGTEVSSEGARVALEKHGLELRVGDVSEIDLPLGVYDAITLWHVLEHVAEPSVLIHRCRELLKPGGVLFVAVPNTDLDLKLTKAFWMDALRFAFKGYLPSSLRRKRRVVLPRLELMDPKEEIHLTHFTSSTLERLLRTQAFEILTSALDDVSPETRWRARLSYWREVAFHRMTGLAAGPAIFVAARKSA